MLKGVSDNFGAFLVSLLSVQTVASALAVDLNQTVDESNSTEENALVARTSDRYTIIHKWGADNAATIGAGATVGIMLTGFTALFTNWYSNTPDAEKICGKSQVTDVTDDDGVEYTYYAYSYTTGSNCDSTQRAKTVTNKLSDAFDELHADGSSAVCLDLDHRGTWHGVIGLATKGSGKDPQTVCDGHHAGAKRDEFLQIKAAPAPALITGSTPKRDASGLVKRTSISVSESNLQKGDVFFSDPNQSQAVIAEIASAMYKQSKANSCAGVEGTHVDNQGVSYTYYYYASGRNCDTTAEIKTMVTALDDAWDGLGGYTALCMTMRHGGGTWRGHLGISAQQGTFRATHMC
ncbi:unnamed protein product [Penicillium salamii]|uniref:Secreted protein CSS2 C-terminal domain-containing protein n=1 Tax=Penicillium salamii TaxID=1612424 RepID=A0A9W4JAA5_9EURO|nr:unnamed protein product [Penicillium salamii]